MVEKESSTKGISPDWLVRGVLTKLGDIFDKLTGRGWRPSSSLATSELVERLKTLLDTEARDESPGCKFVPNNIKLKMQWDKFSTDSDESLRRLETELLAAAVDHINDKRYFTHAPLSIEVKPDYFTPGVRLLVSFDKFTDEEREAAIDLSVPGAAGESVLEPKTEGFERAFVATFTVDGSERRRVLDLKKGVRRSVGRTKENDLSVSDPSVSKIHASLTVDDDGRLIVADTGSTNGTFVGGERIAYGKAVMVGERGSVRFGAVDVDFKPQHITKPGDTFPSVDDRPLSPSADVASPPETAASLVDSEDVEPPAPTQPSIPMTAPAPTEPAMRVEYEGAPEETD